MAPVPPAPQQPATEQPSTSPTRRRGAPSRRTRLRHLTALLGTVALATITAAATGVVAPAQAAGTATLTLRSQVQGSPGPAPTFTLAATGTGATAGSTLSGAAPVGPAQLPAGTYALSRSDQVGYLAPQWDCQGQGVRFDWSSQSITLSENANATCTARSDYRTGRLQISKRFSGIDIGTALRANLDRNNATFSVVYDCGAGEVTTTVRGQQNLEVQNVPHGSVCTVRELTPDPTMLRPGYFWGTPTYSAQPVTIDAERASTNVTVTNVVTTTPTIPTTTGTVSVTATVTGARPGLVAGTTFPITLSCGTAGTFTLTPTDGQTLPTPGLPVGTTCTVTDGAPVPPAGSTSPLENETYSWGTTTLTPPTVTVPAGGTAVTLTREILQAPPAAMTIEKRAWSLPTAPVDGAPLPASGEIEAGASLTAGTPVSFSYTVTSTGGSALADVVVRDDRNPDPVCTVPRMEPGAVHHCWWTPDGGIAATP